MLWSCAQILALLHSNTSIGLPALERGKTLQCVSLGWFSLLHFSWPLQWTVLPTVSCSGGCPPSSPSNHRPLQKDTHAQILLPFFPHRPWAAFGKFCASNLQAFLSSFINLAAKTSSSIYSTSSKASFSAAQVFYLPPASQHNSSCKPSTTLQVHPLAAQYSILLIPSPRPTSPAPFLTTPFQTNSPYPCLMPSLQYDYVPFILTSLAL